MSMHANPSTCLPYFVEPTHTQNLAENELHSTGIHVPLVNIRANSHARDDPLPNLGFHINQLLEDDDHTCAESSLSFGELLAYHAKASELAAILNEDSSALSFHSAFATQHGGACPVLEAGPQLLQYPSYQVSMGPFLRADCDVLDSSPNMVFGMNRFGALRSLAAPPRYMPFKELDVHLFDNLAAKPLMTSKEEEKFITSLDTGASHVHASYNLHNTVHALKLYKESVAASKRSGGNRIAPSEYVDLNDLLLNCAHAIGSNNTKSATDILRIVKQHAFQYGSGAERLAYYFAEALEARLSGTGWQIYKGLLQQHRPSFKQVFEASRMYMMSCPFAKALCFYVNQAILDVAEGASTLHIVDVRMTGFQYPSLFKALAARPGGPPQVRLIGANHPHYSSSYGHLELIWEALEKTGRKISQCAASYGVPFHFTPWAGKLGAFHLHDYLNPKRGPHEVLVTLSIYPLRYVMDDVLNPSTLRISLLKMVQNVNPNLYVQGIVTGSYNIPFFLGRFKQALLHFACQYDMVDTFVDRDNIHRVVFESDILGKAVLHIVACEETDVIERVNNYKQWHMVLKEAGLKPLPVNQGVLSKVQDILKSWHKDYIAEEDVGHLLMGWKGRMLHTVSAWRGSGRGSGT